MQKRWTAKELKEKADNEILLELVIERREGLQLNSPLDARLQKVQRHLGKKQLKIKPRVNRKAQRERDKEAWFNHSYPN